MIKPQQLSNRDIPIVNSAKEAKSIAMISAARQSGLPRRELHAEETFADNRIFVAVKHLSSNRTFEFEFTTS